MEYVEGMEDEERAEALFFDLSYLSEHPFELNTVTGEQLRKLPFLSDRQIENILSYRRRYGMFMTVYELKSIEELDFQTIEYLLPFVYIGRITVEKRPFTVENLLKNGSNKLQARYDRCFQQKKGYRSLPDSIMALYPNRRYVGEPFYHSLRYTYAFDDRLQFGLVAEKDAGEPFWNTYHKGYDYYSGHLFVKDIRWLGSLAIGDYKASFGQGLVISHDFTPGRNTMIAQPERRTHGFRRHNSTNESDYFRGAAATVRLDPLDISLFYSYKRLDATLADSNRVSSIKTDGLHRLEREREKRRVLPQQAYGANIRYATPAVCLGVTALACSFGGYEIQPELKPYTLFYFRGSRQVNIGADYLWKSRLFKLYGETAVTKDRAWATLNGLQLTPVSYFSLLALYRYYDRRYRSFFGHAFSQGSSLGNEEGLYLGMQLTPFAYWKVAMFADFFRFPWLKYGVDAPSSGREYMLRLDYAPAAGIACYVRYKYRRKERNATLSGGKAYAVLPSALRRLRAEMQYAVRAVSFKTAAEGVMYDEERGKRSKGFMLSQSVGWKPPGKPFQAALYAALFRTDDYDSRITSYEKAILYAFSMPSFYGKGVRLTANARWDIVERLSLSVKFSCTQYADRDIIGTELEAIEGRRKTEVSTLLGWKF
ncbi:MAG: helix-hairpin-helix domain-containing protein [Tannerellaceae bacterium]|nr:helix-hairpin-helix domain-containing protein [Tannerellaceae bacterium]